MLKGRKSAEVDRLATDLKSRFAENGCPLPFAKKADFVYQLGTRKVTLNAVSSKLVGTLTQSQLRHNPVAPQDTTQTQLRHNSDTTQTQPRHNSVATQPLSLSLSLCGCGWVCFVYAVRMGGGYTDFLEFLETARF